MNIFKHEFRMNIRSIISWSIANAILILVFMSIFTAFSKDAEILQQTLSQFPKELLIAFGLTGLDLSTVLGFFSFLFLFSQICLAIQASNYGFGLVSLEERDMTADFLLTKPVKRSTIMTSKLLAAVASLLVTDAVIWISSFVCINLFKGGRAYSNQTLILLLVSVFPFEWFFLSVGILVSLLMRRVRSVTPLSMALAFGMYVINAFSGMLGDVKLENITPFKHFEPAYIVTNAAYNLPLVLFNVAVILISIVGSYLLYSRRNIHTAN